MTAHRRGTVVAASPLRCGVVCVVATLMVALAGCEHSSGSSRSSLDPIAKGVGGGDRSQTEATAPSGQSPADTGNTPTAVTAAPPVTEAPLDVERFVADPCISLSEAQQEKFNVSSSRSSQDELGVSCIWDVGNGFTSISVSYPVANRNGLSNLYALHATVGFAYLEPTEVHGYPAVYHSVVDHRERGDCGMGVGVRDDMFFTAAIRTRQGNDSCKAVTNVAEAVVQTLKGG